MRIAFGAFEMDTDAVELRHLGERVALEPRVFDVLVYLVRHRDRVVPKEELLDEVWGDRFVTESALSSCVRHIRRVLGDDGVGQRFVRTARGRGYRFVAAVTSAETVPPSPVARRRHNLPPDRTPLFGRDDDIIAIVDALAGHRAVTLLGIGGVGKTRLAVAAGRAALDRFGDGVGFVDLAPVQDEAAVTVAIAHRTGVALSSGDTTAQLAAALADRQTLIILDRAEHVRPALAAVLDPLLDRTAAPCFLVTSREPVGLPGEQLVRVAPLELGTDAPGLFLSEAARLDVAVDPADLDAVHHICELLDGLPLAIELAAAQLRVLGPRQLADRLDRRFDLLRRSSAGGDDRHASLISVLDDTWTLLSPDERTMLGRLTGFPGPFAVTDVEQLSCGSGDDVVSALGGLVDRSLLAAVPGPRRFRLLDTVRAFAQERTDQVEAADIHARWCLEQVGADINAHLFDFELAAWCGDHFDDLSVAEHHLVALGLLTEAATLTSATALAMHADEGARAAAVLDRVDRLLARVEDADQQARLHCTGAMAAMAARSADGIAAHGHAAVVAARRAADPTLVAVALVLASWSTTLTDPAAALAMVEDAAAIAGSDERARDHAAAYRAFHLAMQRRYDEALAQAEAVIDRSTRDGRQGLGRFAAVVAWSACNVLAEPAVSGRYLDELLSRPTADAPMWGNEVLAATIHASAGDGASCAGTVTRVRERLRRRGQDPLPDLLVPAATLAHRRGDDHRAARYLRAVRDADRSTQSFPVTCAYRRVRAAVDVGAADPAASASLESVGAEALAWIDAAAAG